MKERLTGRFFKEIHVQEKEERLELTFDREASGSLIIWLDDPAEDFRFELRANAYSYVKIFLQNRVTHTMSFSLHADVFKDATVRLGLLDLQSDPLRCYERIDLKEEGATFEICTGQLVLADVSKVSDMEIKHHAPHTYGNMHNFAVQYDRSYYEMVANGNIEKGSYGAQSHQETRVLTLGKGHQSKVIPLLLIDENDVKASHALTIGQPDESQLYYLQSRGLSAEAAIGLLAIGYFLPVIDLVDDEGLHERLREEMEERAGLYGH